MPGNFCHLLLAAIALAACGDNAGQPRIVGELESERIEITADVAEPIVEILVAEGTAVSKGELLVRQDAARARARLVEAEAALAEARARLDELVRGPRQEQIAAARANVDGAERDLVFRRAEFVRIEEVHARKLASPELLDRTRAELDAAVTNLDLRRAQLEELLAGTTVEELSQAESALQQAAARRNLIEVDLRRHDLTAPVDGIVDSRLFEIGERPGAGQPVLVLLGGKQPYARVYVAENQRVNVAPGQPARIFVDGLDRPVEGRVRWVASEAAFTPYFALTERDRGRLSYLAKVDILDYQSRLPDGVPVEVLIDTGNSRRLADGDTVRNEP